MAGITRELSGSGPRPHGPAFATLMIDRANEEEARMTREPILTGPKIAAVTRPSLGAGGKGGSFGFIAAFVLLSGCATPREAPWREQVGPIGPEALAGRGYLWVEEIDPLFITSHGPRMKLAPFILYDDQGRYLIQSKDDYPSIPPVSLRPGRYIVVPIGRPEKERIQVLIREGKVTRVNLTELQGDRWTRNVPVEFPPDARP